MSSFNLSLLFPTNATNSSQKQRCKRMHRLNNKETEIPMSDLDENPCRKTSKSSTFGNLSTNFWKSIRDKLRWIERQEHVPDERIERLCEGGARHVVLYAGRRRDPEKWGSWILCPGWWWRGWRAREGWVREMRDRSEMGACPGLDKTEMATGGWRYMRWEGGRCRGWRGTERDRDA